MQASERHDACARERSNVDEVCGALLARVPEPVAENQAALGVRIDDLDRLACGAAQPVTRLQSATVWHGFRCRPDTDHTDWRVEQRDRPERGDDRRTSRHVYFHPLHPLGRLDGYAPCVERDALSNEREDWSG